jgi:4-hydroxybutyrate dehydrogenase
LKAARPRISERTAPVIAVPTTSGTGSEVARGAIIIVDDHRKLGFHSWFLVPKAAICDPELTFGLPPKLTAATGMDAIAHCMETFMAAGLQSAGRWHCTGWFAAWLEQPLNLPRSNGSRTARRA